MVHVLWGGGRRYLSGFAIPVGDLDLPHRHLLFQERNDERAKRQTHQLVDL